MDLTTIGARVKAARLKAGLSQEQLARALDVSVFTVSRLERGAQKNLPVNKLYAVAQALDVSLDVLLKDAA